MKKSFIQTSKLFIWLIFAAALFVTGISMVTPRSIASVEAAGVGTTYEFSYTGDIQEVILTPGRYFVELWGADGGFGESYKQGYGGYSKGDLSVAEVTKFYVGVGGMGKYKSYGTNTHMTSVNTLGGFNGGGSVLNSAASHGSGGGASHIATEDGLLSSLVNNKDAVKIVAGGAGGNGNWQNDAPYHGGGVTGAGTRPGTATGGGASGGSPCTAGTFGQGGNGYGNSGGGSGGGGGWYGGGSGYGGSAGGGGGSSYIGGVEPGSGLTALPNTIDYVSNPSPKLRDGVSNYDIARQNGFVRISKECNTYTFVSEGEVIASFDEPFGENTIDIPSNIPEKVGYEFTHWSVEGDPTVYTKGMTYTNTSDGDVVFNAVFTEALFDVTFYDSNYSPVLLKNDSSVPKVDRTISIGEDLITLNTPASWTENLRWRIKIAGTTGASDDDWVELSSNKVTIFNHLLEYNESSIDFINNYVEYGHDDPNNAESVGKITLQIADIGPSYVVDLEANDATFGTFKIAVNDKNPVAIAFGNQISLPSNVENNKISSLIAIAKPHYRFKSFEIYGADAELKETITQVSYDSSGQAIYDCSGNPLFTLNGAGLVSGWKIKVNFEKVEYQFNIIAATNGQENNPINGLVFIDSVESIYVNSETSFKATATAQSISYKFIAWKIYDHISEKFVYETSGELLVNKGYASLDIDAAWLARYVKGGVVTVVAEYVELYHVQIKFAENNESFGALAITVDDKFTGETTVYSYVDLFLVKGSTVKIQARAYDLYEFDYFTDVNQEEIGVSASSAEIQLNGDREITVAFKPKQFSIIFNAKDADGNTIANPAIYSTVINNTNNTGKVISVNDLLTSINADKAILGYEFKNFTIVAADGTPIKNPENLVIDENILRKNFDAFKRFVITVNYNKLFTLNIKVSESSAEMGDYQVFVEGSTESTTLREFAKDTNLVIRASAKNDTYFKFKEFSGYAPGEFNNEFKELRIKLTMHRTITVYFENKPFPLVVDLNKKGTGTISIDETENLKIGDSVVLTAAPGSGQEIKSWKVNGVSIEALAKNKKYDVQVSKTTVTITLTSGWLQDFGTDIESKVEFGMASATSTIITVTAIVAPLLLIIFLFYFINLRRKTALIKKELSDEYKAKQKFDTSSLLRDLREGKEIGVTDEAVKKAMKDKKNKPDSKN